MATLYMNVAEAYSFHAASGVWLSLPSTLYTGFTLAVVNNLLTTVGGFADGRLTGSLFSLSTTTETYSHCKLCYRKHRAGSGSFDSHRNVDVVEVLTLEWAYTPHCLGLVTGAICIGQLYVAGGYTVAAEPSHSVLSYSLAELISISPKR